MEIKLIDVTYGGIKDISLVLESKKITSIIGDSIEKTEQLLKLLTAELLPEDGSVVLDDLSLVAKRKNKFRKKTAYLGSDYEDMFFSATVYNDIRNMAGRVSKDKLYEFLDDFELQKDILKRNYLNLSDGEKIKICLISLALKNPQVIALFNPTRFLDNKSKNALIRILKKLKHEGKIVVISSQDSDFLIEISDDVVAMENGQIISQCDKYDAFSDYNLMRKLSIDLPSIVKFRKKVLDSKKVKLENRDSINDLIKDVYRNVG